MRFLGYLLCSLFVSVWAFGSVDLTLSSLAITSTDVEGVREKEAVKERKAALREIHKKKRDDRLAELANDPLVSEAFYAEPLIIISYLDDRALHYSWGFGGVEEIARETLSDDEPLIEALIGTLSRYEKGIFQASWNTTGRSLAQRLSVLMDNDTFDYPTRIHGLIAKKLGVENYNAFTKKFAVRLKAKLSPILEMKDSSGLQSLVAKHLLMQHKLIKRLIPKDPFCPELLFADEQLAHMPYKKQKVVFQKLIAHEEEEAFVTDAGARLRFLIALGNPSQSEKALLQNVEKPLFIKNNSVLKDTFSRGVMRLLGAKPNTHYQKDIGNLFNPE
jgi:hypothetical protein